MSKRLLELASHRQTGHDGWVRGRGVSAGLVLVAALCAGCGSGARVAGPGVPSVPRPPVPPSPGPIGPGAVIEPSTVVARQTLPSGPIAHAIEIAEGIRASGGGCTTATVDPVVAGTHFKEQVSCAIGDDEIAISLFADHAALVGSTSYITQGVCFSAATQKNMNLTYVVGDNWIVFPERTANARQLASRLHASLATIHC